MMNIIKKILTSFFLLGCFLANAQQVVIENLYVRPPFQSNFDYYYNDENVTITLRNETDKDQTIVFAGSIKGDAGLEVKLLAYGQGQTPIFLAKGMRKTLTKEEMKGIFNDKTIEVINYDKSSFSILSNRLPADCYTYILQAISAETNNVLGEDAETMFCINAINSINLISPPDSESITNLAISPFSWSPTEANPQNVEFEIQVVELLQGQEPNQVFQSSPLFFEKTGINGFQSNYAIQGIVSPAFEKGKQYAWRIKQTEKAFSKAGYDFENGGYSEVWTFTYQPEQEVEKEDFYVNTIYPPDGEAIPFRNIPFIIKWGEYSNQYERFSADVIITNDNSAYPIVNEKFSENNWFGKGPLEGQKAALKAANAKNVDAMTEEDAQYMPIGPKGENLKTFNLYEEHRKVRWSANITMSTKDIVTSEANVTGSFTAGMGKPILYPLEKEQLKTGKQINFKFKTSEPPANLFPEKMVQSAKNGQLTKFEEFLVYEKCVVEIATDETFKPATIVKQGLGEILDVKNVNEWTTLRDNVYKDMVVKFDLEAGKYFWRVKWLVNPSTENLDFTNSYSESSIQEFCVGENCEQVKTPTPSTTPMAECGGCKFLIPSNTKPMLASNGTIFKIGSNEGFNVRILTIDDKGNGEGILPFNIYSLGAVQLTSDIKFEAGVIPMKVKLEGIKLNTDKILISGKVSSIKKEGIGVNLNIDYPTPEATMNVLQRGGNLYKDWQKIQNEIRDIPKNLTNAANSGGLTTPLGIDEEVAGTNITIALDDFEFSPTSNSFSALAMVEVKEENIIIPFGIKGTCLGISGACQDYTLFLAKNVPMSNFTLKGNTNDIKNATHMVYSFNGPRKFQKIHIAAEYEFKEDILKPKKGNEKVKVQMVADSPNGFADWTATVSMPPFKVAGVEDFIFELDGTATYDHSTQAQPAGMKTMLDALKDKVEADGKAAIANIQDDSWMGFYLPKLKVQLPDVFKADQKDNVSISVENLIIDSHHGLCGSLNANNVFGIGAGNLDGWYYSLDNIQIAFFNGSLLTSSANGKVVLPISGNPNENATQLDYDMLLTQNSTTDKSLKYQFQIKPNKDVNVPIWRAKMTLAQTSNITLSVGDKQTNNGKFLAKADLNGEISFETPEVGSLLPSYSLKLTKFEHFKIQSASPYLDFGNTSSNLGDQIAKIGDEQFTKYNSWLPSLASPQKEVNGSPVSLDEFSPIVKIQGQEVLAGFYIHGSLNLSDDIPLSPKAGLGMGILASMKMEGGRPKFGFKGVELNDIYVKGELGPVSVEGSLKFYNGDNEFGDGFKGSIATKFPMGIDISTGVQAMFGSKNNFNYWYVYASITGFTIPIGPQPIINITGFGGGAYHNMKSNYTPSLTNLPSATLDKPYLPQDKSNGCLATVFVNGVQENLLKAQATLQVQWDNNGITQVGLTGDINLFNESTAPSSRGVANGNLNAIYDVRNEIFDLTGGVNANMYNGAIVLNADNTLRIYIDKNTQFMQVGNPDPNQGQRVKLTILNMLEGNSYFWAGNGAMPDVPLPYGIDLATLQKMGYRSFKDLGFSNASGGMMFGAYAGFPAGGKKDEDLRFLIFFMKMHAKFGFDVQLAKFTGTCPSTNQPPGMNGWYAMGQIYGSVGFAFGLHVDVWFYEGDIEVASIDATAIMQGGLPNPMWFKGMLNASYSVLGGVVSGDMNFKVSVGDVCLPETPPSNPFTMPLIAEIYPKGTNKIDILDNPSARFNYPVGKEIVITSTVMKKDGEGSEIRIETFKIEVDFTMKRLSGTNEGDCANVQDDTGDFRLATDGMRANFYRNSAFVPDSKYELVVTGKPYKKENDTWVLMKDKEGKDKIQVERETFNTGPCPTKLSKNAIAITYPYFGQRNVLQNEFNNEGVIAFNKKLCCFGNDCGPNKAYTLVMKFASEDNPDKEIESTVENNIGGNGYAQTLTFKLPKLTNEKIYRMRLVKKPNPEYFKNLEQNFTFLKSFTFIDTSISEEKRTYKDFEKFNNYTDYGMSNVTKTNSINTMTIERNDEQKIEYKPKEIQVAEESFFRTSKYNTMLSKLNAISNSATGIVGNENALLKLQVLQANFSIYESFDRYEIGGKEVQIKGETKYLEPLLGWEFAADRSNWYQNEIEKIFLANIKSRQYKGRIFNPTDDNGYTKDRILPTIRILNWLEPFNKSEVPVPLLIFTPININLNQAPIKIK